MFANDETGNKVSKFPENLKFTSQDKDKVSTIVLNKVLYIILCPLTAYLTVIILTGTFPKKSKKALRQLPKQVNLAENNYRPLYTLPLFTNNVEGSLTEYIYDNVNLRIFFYNTVLVFKGHAIS